MVEKTKGGARKEEVVTRKYTINLHKRLHGCTFKKKALHVRVIESNALIKNKTWTLVPRPADTNVVRLNGSTQVADIDVDETFSLVGQLVQIRTVIVLLLLRCDSSLIVYKHGTTTAYLLLYIDDILLTTSLETLLQQIISSLHQKFSMIDLGSLNYFLSISVTRDSFGMFLSQRKYAVEILERAHMANCTDIAKISRKRSKPDNHGHGNGIECAKAERMLSKIRSPKSKICEELKPREGTEEDKFLTYRTRDSETIVTQWLNRTWRSLLRAPQGYGEAIVLPEINADHFEIKTNLLQLVQANPFYGRESENPHAHINSFKRITSTLRFRNVPNDVIKLMMFPYSLEGAAKTWYEKEPPNSILTWEDLVTKFVNQFFPPSKTTHLKNEISRFTQKFEETFSEAWERFKELLRACPHHGFTELTQVDTFYNGLNENEQDSLNAAAGGNLLSKTTREALNIIENKSKVRYSRNRSNASRMNATSSKTDERIDKLADQLSTLVEIVSKKVPLPLRLRRLRNLAYFGVAHFLYNCPTTNNNQC
ncbi:reverse transcriptase domain-containing protein [Tanacetum coccineum]